MRLFLSGLKTAGLGGKILWGKGLATRYSVFNELFLTACAGAMMNEFEMGCKVRCHRGRLWKIVGVEIHKAVESSLFRVRKTGRTLYRDKITDFRIVIAFCRPWSSPVVGM